MNSCVEGREDARGRERVSSALHRMAAGDDDLVEQLDSPYAPPARAARAALAAAVARDLPASLNLT